MRLFRRPLAALLVAAALVARPAAAQRVTPRPATPPTSKPSAAGSATAGSATASTGTLFTVTGTAYDSSAAEPLAGATVQLLAAGDNTKIWVGTAEANGSFRIDSVPGGNYLVAIVHPTLDVLGIESPVIMVRVGPGMDPLRLGIPGSQRLFAALCPSAAPYDSVGALVGRVREADSDAGVVAKVVVTWTELQLGVGKLQNVRRRIPVTTRPDGGYLVCNLPSNASLQADAEAPRHTGGLIEVTLPMRGVLRRDFALADSAGATVVVLNADSVKSGAEPVRVLRGSARVAGTVRTKNGQPLSGARITVEGTGLAASTAEDGTFSITGLPAGTYTLVSRAVGYEPRVVPVDLASRRTSSAAVVMDTRVQTLSSVTVYGKKTRASRDLDAFLERKAHGFGKYITGEDLDRTHPQSLGDALRMTPGIQVQPNGVGYAIRGRGGCTPAVVLDGMPIAEGANDIDTMVRPDQVSGIEVYSGSAGAPVEYSPNGCGLVLIWTKR